MRLTHFRVATLWGSPLHSKETNMKKILMALTSVATLLCANGAANAGTIQGTLGVSLTIGNGCVVTGGTSTGTVNNFGSISFGTYSSLSNIITASSTGTAGAGSSIGLNCTDGTAYTVALDNGLNASSGQRRMASSVPAYISYNLYQDAAHTQTWDNTTNVLAGTGTGAVVPLTVYGLVPAAGTTPAAGAYNDTVTMTVTW
jgi:spore coat protein U-like protein